MLLRFFVAVFICASAPAFAEVSVKEEVPFRQDSGLTKAEYFIATHKYAEALSEAAGVIKRHGVNADAYTYMGLAYQRLGDTKKAKESLDRALQISPTHLGANAYKTMTYIDAGNMPKALEQMQVLRSVCGASGCEELVMIESAVNAAKKGATSAKPASAAAPVRGEAE